MIGVARGLAAVLVALSAVPIWLSPGPASPAMAAAAVETAAEIVEEQEYDDCTFRLINRYFPEDGTQQVRTRQVWSEDCRFGSRNRTILVKVCFADPEDGTPVDCSSSLMPTSDTPYAESEITTSAPRDSIHYFEIRGTGRRFDLSAPKVPPPSPSPAPAPPPEPAPEPSPAPAAAPTDDPSPATTSPATTAPAAGGGSEPAATRPPAKASPRPDDRHGLVAALATGGAALLGLGGTGIWLLRRGGSGRW